MVEVTTSFIPNSYKNYEQSSLILLVLEFELKILPRPCLWKGTEFRGWRIDLTYIAYFETNKQYKGENLLLFLIIFLKPSLEDKNLLRWYYSSALYCLNDSKLHLQSRNHLDLWSKGRQSAHPSFRVGSPCRKQWNFVKIMKTKINPHQFPSLTEALLHNHTLFRLTTPWASPISTWMLMTSALKHLPKS